MQNINFTTRLENKNNPSHAKVQFSKKTYNPPTQNLNFIRQALEFELER